MFATRDLPGCYERHSVCIEGPKGFLRLIPEAIQESVDCDDFFEDQAMVLLFVSQNIDRLLQTKDLQ